MDAHAAALTRHSAGVVSAYETADPSADLRLFTLNVEAYPSSSNARDSLAYGYAARGQNDLALAAVRKCLDLLPADRIDDRCKAVIRQAAAKKMGGLVGLTLDCPMDGHGRKRLCVSRGDADAYYREWCGRVAVLRPPRDEDWDARTFDVLDPFGNTIFMIGPVPTTARRE